MALAEVGTVSDHTKTARLTLIGSQQITLLFNVWNMLQKRAEPLPMR
jgi:hypothetical protein